MLIKSLQLSHFSKCLSYKFGSLFFYFVFLKKSYLSSSPNKNFLNLLIYNRYENYILQKVLLLAEEPDTKELSCPLGVGFIPNLNLSYICNDSLK